MVFLAMRLLLADVLFCCWVIFGLLSFLRVLGVLPYAPTKGCRTCAEYRLRQGAGRVRNIPYSEGAQRVKNASTHTSKGSFLGAE